MDKLINYSAERAKFYMAVKGWRKKGLYIHPDANLNLDGKSILNNFYCQYHVAQLLGVEEISYMTPEQMDTVRALAGPNGYALYRTLLIKRGLADD